MAVAPSSNFDPFLSLSGGGTIYVTEIRNKTDGWIANVTVELGYALCALASLVETVARAALTLVLAALFVVSVPFSALWLENYFKNVLDPDKNDMLLFLLIGGYTTVYNANQVFVNLVALIQHPRRGVRIIERDDLTFAALCNCCASDNPSPEEAGERKDVKQPEAQVEVGA